MSKDFNKARNAEAGASCVVYQNTWTTAEAEIKSFKNDLASEKTKIENAIGAGDKSVSSVEKINNMYERHVIRLHQILTERPIEITSDLKDLNIQFTLKFTENERKSIGQ